MYLYVSMHMYFLCTSFCLYSVILKDGEPLLVKRKRWWRLVAILTFTSFVMLVEKGDRPTDQSSSLFPSGRLKLNNYQGKRMIGGIGDMLFSINSHT